LGGLSSRVPFEVSSAVQLVVCIGECTDMFWIRLAGCLLRSVCCSIGGVGLLYGDFLDSFWGGAVLRCRLLSKWWWCMGECTQVFRIRCGAQQIFSV